MIILNSLDLINHINSLVTDSEKSLLLKVGFVSRHSETALISNKYRAVCNEYLTENLLVELNNFFLQRGVYSTMDWIDNAPADEVVVFDNIFDLLIERWRS